MNLDSHRHDWVRPATAALALGLTLAATGCAIEFENRQAAQTLAAQQRPAGTAYAGWRVYQDKCAGCHGADATGTSSAPDLLPRVRTMGARQFTSLVLLRYDWGLPAQARTPGPEHERQVDEVNQRQARPLTMPAWQGEPSVTVHIADLYAYLSGRAQGSLGPGRPAP